MASILSEIFEGEASSLAASGYNVSEHVKTFFVTMRFIVGIGCCTYPLGYVFWYLLGSMNNASLNRGYHLADAINKIALYAHSPTSSDMVWRLLTSTEVTFTADSRAKAVP